jgi:hypothetical protein
MRVYFRASAQFLFTFKTINMTHNEVRYALKGVAEWYKISGEKYFAACEEGMTYNDVCKKLNKMMLSDKGYMTVAWLMKKCQISVLSACLLPSLEFLRSHLAYRFCPYLNLRKLHSVIKTEDVDQTLDPESTVAACKAPGKPDKSVHFAYMKSAVLVSTVSPCHIQDRLLLVEVISSISVLHSVEFASRLESCWRETYTPT